MDIYQQFIHKSRYARWLDNENRRETWEETVKRYFDFFEKLSVYFSIDEGEGNLEICTGFFFKISQPFSKYPSWPLMIFEFHLCIFQ